VVKKAVSALVGLGLIGGAGKVAYNHNGDATVKITGKNGRVQTVQIQSDHGTSYSCPAGTHDQVEPLDVELGRIELTLRSVRRSEKAIDRRYPGRVAPHAVVVRFNSLVRREHRLVTVYNTVVDRHNAIIDRACQTDSTSVRDGSSG
jgi:hypothetical protein